MTAAETTRERLLDAAEACFAEIGFHAASVRMITERAGANLAAVHYHFGGKNGLIEAVITRRIGPVQAERLRRLAAVCQDRPPRMEVVVRALLEPTRDVVQDRDQTARVAGLIGRIWFDPASGAAEVLQQHYADFQQRFLDAFAACRPDLSREQLRHRLHFIFGAMSHGLVSPALHGKQGAAIDEAFEELLRFTVAGMEG